MAKAKIRDNSKKVVKAAKVTVEGALNRVGAYGRKVAQNLMKKGKDGQPSQPGKPPKYHAEKPNRLKDAIGFAFDPITESVVVGPTRDNQGRSKGAKALEHGGRVTKKTPVYDSDAEPAYLRNRENQDAILRENERVAKAYRLKEAMRKRLLKKTGSDQPIGRHGKQRPKGYRYFYSKEKRDKALNSSNGRFKKWADKKNRERRAAKRKLKYKTEQITIQPRPYMAPAFVEAMKRLPEEFAKIKK